MTIDEKIEFLKTAGFVVELIVSENWTRLDVRFTYDGYSHEAVGIWNADIENKPVSEIIEEVVEMAREEAIEKALHGIY